MTYPVAFHQDKSRPPIGHLFIELDSVGSSNNYAMERIRDGKASHGTVFFAYEQTEGKGQRGRKWLASKGENIQMTIVLQPVKDQIHQSFALSAAIALGCYELLNLFLPDLIAIKWPNDLYIRDRKAGGILIENLVSGNDWNHAIVGIGININQTVFNPDIPRPGSLKLETGKNYDPMQLAKTLCNLLEIVFAEYSEGNQKKIVDRYNDHLYKKNEKVKLKKGTQVFETTIREVNNQGELITFDVMERSFESGSVELQSF